MALQRARVPASRDVTERIHAEGVMAEARQLDVEGKLSSKSMGFEEGAKVIQLFRDNGLDHIVI